jgi:hypothetical protein
VCIIQEQLDAHKRLTVLRDVLRVHGAGNPYINI